MSLHVEVRGSGAPLVLLHGFTQTARLWGPFGDRLAEKFTLIGIDLPGHAGSDSVRADLPATAVMVAEAVAAEIGDVQCDLLGYSLGARVALHVVLGHHLDLRRLTLISATGGIEDEAVRQQRRLTDEATADALETSGDVNAFIDEWVSGPMFDRLGSAAGSEERSRNTATGLASSLRLAGTGTQEPLWERLARLTTPTLALAGTDDWRFSAHALRLAQCLPNGVATLVPGAGHAVHLAQPGPTARLVLHWLSITSNPPQSPE